MMQMSQCLAMFVVAFVALLPSTHAAAHGAEAVKLMHVMGEGILMVHNEEVAATKDALVLLSPDGTMTDFIIMEAEKFVLMGYAVAVCSASAIGDDLTLMATREVLVDQVRTCVRWVKEQEQTTSKVALVGWGLGGTAVLYCVKDTGDMSVGAMAGVAYTPDISPPILPSFRSSSGVEFPVWVAVDYEHYAHLEAFEKAMDNMTLEWEVSMLSDTKMHFNVKGHADYNEAADLTTTLRSTAFLSDKFGATSYEAGTTQPARTVATLTETHLNYSFGDEMLPGALIYDAAKATATNKMPAIVVVPAWGGYTEYELERQNFFAQQGYVTMSANIYGEAIGYVVPQAERTPLVGTYRAANDDAKAELFANKIMAAVAEVKKLPFVDSANVGTIGFCFGGTGVYNLYRTGKDIQAGVSMHGSMITTRDMSKVTSLNAPGKLLMVSGGLDGGEEGADMTQHLADLSKFGVEWEVQRFSQVNHGFSEWGGRSFNARAEGRGFHATDDVYKAAFGMDRVAVPARPAEPFMTFAEIAAEIAALNGNGTTTPTTGSAGSAGSASLFVTAVVSVAMTAFAL